MEKEYKKITLAMRNALREALPQKACKPHPTKTFMTSINPMYVIERLNDVFGVGSFQIRNEVVLSDFEKHNCIVVKVSFSLPEYNIYLEQFGGNDNGGKFTNEGKLKKGFDLGDCFKGACTDGLTKIASYLEIGINIFKNEGNTSTLIVDENAEIEKKEQEKTKKWNEFFINMQVKLEANPFDSLREYTDFIYSEYTKKTPSLIENKRFKAIEEQYRPKPENRENLAKQSVNKFDKCNTCSNETEFCICDIDKKVLTKV